MFICEKCYLLRAKDSFGFDIASQSTGPCEECGYTKTCADINMSSLPPLKTINIPPDTTISFTTNEPDNKDGNVDIKDLPVVKKAYFVKDPTVWEGGEYCPPEEGWELVYANNLGLAKQLCTETRGIYTNIRGRRSPGNDIILYNGTEIKRYILQENQKEADRIRERTNKVVLYPETEMFYIQARGFVGNSCLWWALGGSGYTTDIEKAQKYTRKEVLDRFVKGREHDKIWPVSHVDTVVKKHVDAQYLDYDQQS